MIRIKHLVLAGLIASLGLLVASALASTATVHDPTGDVGSATLPHGVSKADVDITKATAGKSGQKIELTVRVDGKIGKALGDIQTAPGFLIKEPGNHLYDVYQGPNGYLVSEEAPHGTRSHAELTKPDGHTASLTFKPGAIGHPSSYDWYGVTGVCAPLDRAPNHGFTSSKSGKRC
jgi:hypothetical protein